MEYTIDCLIDLAIEYAQIFTTAFKENRIHYEVFWEHTNVKIQFLEQNMDRMAESVKECAESLMREYINLLN